MTVLLGIAVDNQRGNLTVMFNLTDSARFSHITFIGSGKIVSLLPNAIPWARMSIAQCYITSYS
jgi:hypothetical protein